MYFEIYKKGILVKYGDEILNEVSFSVELMDTPSTSLTLPIEYLDYISGREEIKIYVNGKVFWGIITDIEADKVNETVRLDIDHIVKEWEYRQISVNNAVKDKNINVIYKGSEISKANGETISANPFDIYLREVGKLSSSQYIARSGAVAWVTSTGRRVAITSVDHSSVKTEEGDYTVTFKTKKGTSVKVTCTVKDQFDYKTPKTHTDKTNNETISATPFNVSETRGMTVSEVKKAVKAKAWVYKHKDQKVEVTSITTNFENEPGTYHVTASTARGTSITVNIRVVEGGDNSQIGDPSIIDNLSDIFADTNFAYPGWQLEFLNGSGDANIDYVYSRQNKLEALTKTCELTPSYFWRVDFSGEKRIDIGSFGGKKPYILSTKPSGKHNIRIIEEPDIDYDFENVINLATVYSEKSDGGMSSLTLREVYNNPSLQIDKFPVVILRANVNNERDYRMYSTQYPKLAPNNEMEYAVIDEESVALEGGAVIEGTYAFDDLGSFNVDSEVVTDRDRVIAAKTAYHAVVKKLKQARRSIKLEVTTEEIPSDIKVGDKIRFLYDNSIFKLDACSNYMKKILTIDDWFYVTKIEYEIGEAGVETDTLTIQKYLKIDRETENT